MLGCAAAGTLALGAPPATPQVSGVRAAEILLSRVGPPSALAIQEFRKAGMQSVVPHSLTDEERARIGAALASLPPLNRRVLAAKLHALAFVDGVPGEGTGLTSRAAQPGLFDITLRATVIDESLTHFLTVKERRVFTDNAPGNSVVAIGQGADALTYVLLHESSHVVDRTCHITDSAGGGFDAGIWTGYNELAPALAIRTPKTYFRGAGKRPIAQAPQIYDALAETPFVSLYATASREEDFAELMAWWQISQKPGGSLTIVVANAQGGTQRRWYPLSFPKVQARFSQLRSVIATPGTCAPP